MGAKPGPAKNGYQLPDEKWQQRERAFEIYRDMGEGRTLIKLVAVLKQEHPDIAASKTSIEAWSQAHNWRARAEAHDAAVEKGRKAAAAQPAVPAPAPSMIAPVAPEEDFDQITALVKAANTALTKAMNANPVITRPGEMKLLVDAAANALKLVETIKNQSSGKVSREEIAQEMVRILGEVRKAREVDVDAMVEARLKALGLNLTSPIRALWGT
jgi:hypothetical protein